MICEKYGTWEGGQNGGRGVTGICLTPSQRGFC